MIYVDLARLRNDKYIFNIIKGRFFVFFLFYETIDLITLYNPVKNQTKRTLNDIIIWKT